MPSRCAKLVFPMLCRNAGSPRKVKAGASRGPTRRNLPKEQRSVFRTASGSSRPLKTAKSNWLLVASFPAFFPLKFWNATGAFSGKLHEPRLRVEGEQPSITLRDLTNLLSQHPPSSVPATSGDWYLWTTGWDLRRRMIARHMEKEGKGPRGEPEDYKIPH